MKDFTRYLPWAAGGLAALYLLMMAVPPADPEDGFHLYEFSKLPAVDGGRVKPLDTVARTSLMMVSNRQDFDDESGRTQPAIKWLLDVLSSAGKDSSGDVSRKIFRIDDEKLLDLFELKPTPDHLYSWDDLQKNPERFDAFRELATRASRVSPSQRTATERGLMDLAVPARVYLFLGANTRKQKVFRIENDQLLGLLDLKPRKGFRYSVEEFAPHLAELIQQADRARDIDEKQRDVFNQKVLELSNRLNLVLELATEKPLLVPPRTPDQGWKSFLQARSEALAESNDIKQRFEAAAAAHGKIDADQIRKYLASYIEEKIDPGTLAYESMFKTYAAGDVKGFNQALDKYQESLDKKASGDTGTAGFETFLNHFEPFYHCCILYGVVFGLCCLSWMGWHGILNWSAFYVAAVALSVHTFALLSRMYIQGRPPVTNLYSSAVYIGWGALVLGMVLEVVFRNGFANLVTSVIGFLTLLVAHHLASEGDTMEMMRAVLDTNFWLATHVTCVTFGYMATFVAGALGILFIILGVLTSALDRSLTKTAGQMIYGVVCFATLLSFTGTVLGGIWADQSWGRFWGWDSKENGALLIVIWNALILHARWAGLVKARGMAVLAVGGNMFATWSWFGTNQLGIGLHAYGFNASLAIMLRWFWVSQGAVIAVGLVPFHRWRSFDAQKIPLPAPPVANSSGHRSRGNRDMRIKPAPQ